MNDILIYILCVLIGAIIGAVLMSLVAAKKIKHLERELEKRSLEIKRYLRELDNERIFREHDRR